MNNKLILFYFLVVLSLFFIGFFVYLLHGKYFPYFLLIIFFTPLPLPTHTHFSFNPLCAIFLFHLSLPLFRSFYLSFSPQSHHTSFAPFCVSPNQLQWAASASQHCLFCEPEGGEAALSERGAPFRPSNQRRHSKTFVSNFVALHR